MITEDYVSFETAKLLKEKGFDWIVERSFLEHNNYYVPCDPSHIQRKDAIAIPTLQMAMKWLRKKYKCIILFDVSAYGTYDWYYIYGNGNRYHYEEMTFDYNELEEAAEAAIKYCLENLI